MDRGWRSGPRLPAGPSLAEPEDLADPAQGAKVPRCGACGMPDPTRMRGVWNGLMGSFPLCERCWFSQNPPDPLDVSRVA
jgi:hypothetical protein